MTTELAAIEQIIQTYLDGIYEGDAAKLQQAMHPDCRMISVSQNSYQNIDMTNYFGVVTRRQSPKSIGQDRTDTLLAINLIDQEIASVRLTCQVLAKDCEDMLTLVKGNSGWQIISKVYRYQIVPI